MHLYRPCRLSMPPRRRLRHCPRQRKSVVSVSYTHLDVYKRQLLSVLLVLCIIMAGTLIGKEYIADNIKEAANQNGVDVVKDTSDKMCIRDSIYSGVFRIVVKKRESRCTSSRRGYICLLYTSRCV